MMYGKKSKTVKMAKPKAKKMVKSKMKKTKK
jgi:hypothetical protein